VNEYLPSPASLRNLRRDLREHYHSARTAVITQFRQRPQVEMLLRRLCQVTDQAVRDTVAITGLPEGCALVAVGGYGRGELFPYSDVDLLLLLPGSLTEREQQQISDFISLCWDVGLEVGHGVRTIDECLCEAGRDISVQTSLLESRFLTGQRALYQKFLKQFRRALDPRAFFRAKMAEMHQRHVKYEDTPFSLEPNCKESPGGLRDLQVISWVARAAGLGKNWNELAKAGLLTPLELRALKRNERLLRQTRARLHLVAGRREDRLVFDVQTALAADFGLQATGSRRASELLMQSYYWSAKAVQQLNTLLLQNLEERIFGREHAAALPINERFNSVNSLLDIADDQLFEKQPAAMLEAFLVMQQHPELKGMSVRTLRALWHERNRIDASFRRQPENRAIFLKILQQPSGVLHELRRMNQTSILGRYLPVFRRIVGQMQHDLFHVYTVDQHILMVVRNLRRFTMPEHAHEYPLCSQLISDFDKPWLLYIAALFHDIAKGRGGDHSELGKIEARKFCREHGLSKEDTALVAFLVERHLTMSQVAQKQDLSDPEVIHQFARMVKTERHLVALYLLTVADIRGTSPKVWNGWKAKLLENLFRGARRVLSGSTPTVHADYEARQQEARTLLARDAIAVEAYEAIWARFDVAFFLRHDASTVAWLTKQLIQAQKSDKPIVKARLATESEGLEIMVCVADQPDLFARICGYFDTRRYSILDAKVHTTRDGYALDTFIVVDADALRASADHYRHIATLVEYELAQAIQNQAELPAPATGRIPRQTRHFPITPSVDLRPDDKGQFHLLSVTAADRSGLLYSIARVLARHHVNLHTAKIATLGGRVEDLFLVDGEALSHARTQIQLETELMDVLSVN
jgi:[protein-PII] uridylyltransferase